VLALPLVSLAQDSDAKKEPKHHHYKVVDLGTLGGPQSFLNEEGVPVFPGTTILNHAGLVAAGAGFILNDIKDQSVLSHMHGLLRKRNNSMVNMN
jgi:hypothetical protein